MSSSPDGEVFPDGPLPDFGPRGENVTWGLVYIILTVAAIIIRCTAKKMSVEKGVIACVKHSTVYMKCREESGVLGFTGTAFNSARLHC